MPTNYIRDLGPAKWASAAILRGSKAQRHMSALGQKQTLGHVRVMSALPPKADITAAQTNVRFLPKADSCSAANSGWRLEFGGPSPSQLGRGRRVQCYRRHFIERDRD